MKEDIEIPTKQNTTIRATQYINNKNHIIIFSHGYLGDRHEFGLFDAIIEALDEKYSYCTFDYVGCGLSDDALLSVQQHRSDLEDVISYYTKKGFERIIVIGHSLGCLMALQLHQRIDYFILLAPVTQKSQYSLDKYYSTQELEELQQKGYITKIINNRVMKVAKHMFDEREQLNQQALLKDITKKGIIIHGDKDTALPVQDSIDAKRILQDRCTLYIIKDADHIFKGKQDEVIGIIKSYIKEL
ncbi:MAG: alpha/beta hydrolase [Candidatus Woesearchaeota archaeon]